MLSPAAERAAYLEERGKVWDRHLKATYMT